MGNSNSFTDQACLHGNYRGRSLEEGELRMFPHSCIGMLRTRGSNGSSGEATGCLISNSLVLTAAHPFFSLIDGVLHKVKPYQFCLNLHKEVSSSQKYVVRSYRCNKNFEAIYKKLQKIKKSSEEFYRIIKESQKYDYALIKIESTVERASYPKLFPNFKEEGRKVTVCGYSDTVNGYFQSYHFNPLDFSPTGGFYDIDSMRGQSGSPVYYLEDTNRASSRISRQDRDEVCLIVGIHKGFDKRIKKNTCCLIDQEVISTLEQWAADLNVLFGIKSIEKERQLSFIGKDSDSLFQERNIFKELAKQKSNEIVRLQTKVNSYEQIVKLMSEQIRNLKEIRQNQRKGQEETQVQTSRQPWLNKNEQKIQHLLEQLQVEQRKEELKIPTQEQKAQQSFVTQSQGDSSKVNIKGNSYRDLSVRLADISNKEEVMHLYLSNSV